mmetsp:Transcript_29609/g.27057  ORF Transcript_29609/g.27057 Transcript_29609/m.27057 type:complete len:85 (-) Transcript_29609:2394-2648(-)
MYLSGHLLGAPGCLQPIDVSNLKRTYFAGPILDPDYDLTLTPDLDTPDTCEEYIIDLENIVNHYNQPLTIEWIIEPDGYIDPAE